MDIIKNDANIQREQAQFPSVLINDPNPQSLPLIISSLSSEKINPVPLLVYNQNGNGAIRLKVDIDFTPLEIKKILRVYPVIIIYSKEEKVPLSIDDKLLERSDIRWTV